MTARRGMPFGAGRDARAEAAVAPLLASLRGDLLVVPDEQTVAAHLEMMQLEQQLLASEPRRSTRVPRRVLASALATRRVPRVVVPRPRRSVCVIATVCLAFASCGLDAVGALPAPLQHFSDSIKHHLGIDGPTPDQPRSVKRTEGAIRAHPAVDSVSPTAPSASASPRVPGSSSVTAVSAKNPGAVTSSLGVAASTPPTAVTGPTSGGAHHPPPARPPKKSMHSGGGPPPGLPADWPRRAVTAAVTQLSACAGADVLSPTGCPQQASAADSSATPDAVHWALLNQLRTGAVAVMQPVPIGTTNPNGAATVVNVYGRFQMAASYTLAGDTTTHLAYSAGIAQATMTWDGSSFQNVVYASGSVAQLPVGVTLPAFARPAAVTNDAVNATVAAGFQACVVGAPAPTDASVENCPQHTSVDAGATNLQWSLGSDPLQGAVTGFDGQSGEFTVSGTYTMTLNYDGATAADPPGSVTVTAAFRATLFFDGTQVRLVGIAGEI